jgi:hypothetical protein
MDSVVALPTLDDLQRHVLERLCGHDQLDVTQTALQRSIILRRGRPCGLFFLVRGPRLVTNSAVWSGEENRIIFYDSAGLRFGETRLSEGPDPLKLAS